jgi:hypothetical protein
MTRQELERWLGGDGAALPTMGDVATLLGVPPVAARAFAPVRFTVAVLRDVFPDDGLVRRWLRAPRAEFDGLSGLDLLWAGNAGAVERLAVREWHDAGATAGRARAG